MPVPHPFVPPEGPAEWHLRSLSSTQTPGEHICGGGGGCTVTQPGLNILQTDTVGKQQAGAAVPQIVEPNPTHVVLLQKLGQFLR